MGKGPCGEEFKNAFSCFHYSESEPKGSDCLTQFKDMQECFVKHPEIYGSMDEEDDENESVQHDNEVADSSLDVTEKSHKVLDEDKSESESAKLDV